MYSTVQVTDVEPSFIPPSTPAASASACSSSSTSISSSVCPLLAAGATPLSERRRRTPLGGPSGAVITPAVITPAVIALTVGAVGVSARVRLVAVPSA
eukprot:CAMPEP_0181370234 /NCGR_PEP_ID=MMETSP1106-20121128/13299_1 /TAXON_ID=81844 /ORGANISM="Mantoniella antarctica, Strain SL-175" /LENGTH=97 /DNA_ID=CAMNT_0023486977 /DNA_START=247 /DNA_END=537 /DNA_ORIENTATION=+